MAEKTLLRDRFVAAACNWLLEHVASKQYHAFVASVYAAGRPALLWRLKNTRPESDSLGLNYTLLDARDALVELEAVRERHGADAQAPWVNELAAAELNSQRESR